MSIDEFIQYMDPSTFSVVFRDYPIFVAGVLFGAVVTFLVAYFWSIKPHIWDKRLLASKLHELELDIQERDEDQLALHKRHLELQAVYEDQRSRNNGLARKIEDLGFELSALRMADAQNA